MTSVSDHNKQVEAQELAEWSTQPDRFCAYIVRAKAPSNGFVLTTWLGTELGVVKEANTYRNNLGARITSYRIRGNNGAMYYGRHGDMQLIRLRKVKK